MHSNLLVINSVQTALVTPLDIHNLYIIPPLHIPMELVPALQYPNRSDSTNQVFVLLNWISIVFFCLKNMIYTFKKILLTMSYPINFTNLKNLPLPISKCSTKRFL